MASMDRIQDILNSAVSAKGPEPDDPHEALHAAWEGLLGAIHANDAASCVRWSAKVAECQEACEDEGDEAEGDDDGYPDTPGA